MVLGLCLLSAAAHPNSVAALGFCWLSVATHLDSAVARPDRNLPTVAPICCLPRLVVSHILGCNLAIVFAPIFSNIWYLQAIDMTN